MKPPSVHRPAEQVLDVVSQDYLPCAACGFQYAQMRAVGAAFCRICVQVVVKTCLCKIPLPGLDDARRAALAGGGQAYPCRFCRTLHLTVKADVGQRVKPDRQRRLDLMYDALSELGALGRTFNQNVRGDLIDLKGQTIRG